MFELSLPLLRSSCIVHIESVFCFFYIIGWHPISGRDWTSYVFSSYLFFLRYFFFFSSRRRHTRSDRDWEFRRVLFRSARWRRGSRGRRGGRRWRRGGRGSTRKRSKSARTRRREISRFARNDGTRCFCD